MRQAAEEGLNASECSPSGHEWRRRPPSCRPHWTKTGRSPDRCWPGRWTGDGRIRGQPRMGRIVAAPTAGSCGILPAVILTLAEEKALDERTAGLGSGQRRHRDVIANQASLSRCGRALPGRMRLSAAMAAAAAVEMLGGSPLQACRSLCDRPEIRVGLVCDPVAGWSRCPASSANASGAANALVCRGTGSGRHRKRYPGRRGDRWRCVLSATSCRPACAKRLPAAWPQPRPAAISPADWPDAVRVTELTDQARSPPWPYRMFRFWFSR